MDGVLSNGLQQLFQVNYLGHYLLYRALEDTLTSTVGLPPPSSSNTTNRTDSIEIEEKSDSYPLHDDV